MAEVHAIDQLGITQQRLLKTLLRFPKGATVEDLEAALGITTTAVRQHLNSLTGEGFVVKGEPIATGRRPQMRFHLSEAGREAFPRHYGVLADQVIAYTHAAQGPEGLKAMMRELGTQAGLSVRIDNPNPTVGEAGIFLANLLQSAGYEAPSPEGNSNEVIAHNCVFHHLATKYREICEYDLALIESATGMKATHLECMVRGGNACRFALALSTGKGNP